MEVEVGLTRRQSGDRVLGALLERGPQILEVGLGRALGGERGDLGLDEPAGLDELRPRHPAESEQRLEVAHQRSIVHLADEVAAGRAPAGGDEAPQLQRAEGLAHGGAARVEVARELALGRQLLALAQASVVDRALDVADDLLVYSRRSDCAWHGARQCRLKRVRSQAPCAWRDWRTPASP